MAIATGQEHRFYFGTSAQYAAATKNDNYLYFLTDTKQIYVGEDLYTGSFEFVNEFPKSPSQGILYCNPTTHETKAWNGTAWQVMVPAIDTAIDANSTANDHNLADIGAIKEFVADQIGDAYTITKQATADTGYAATYQLFKGDTAVGDKINIPKDMVVESGSVKTATAEDVTAEIYPGVAVGDLYIDLVIANSDNEHLYIPANSLVEFPTVADTSTVDLTMNAAHEISAAVNISAETGNALEAKADGLFVDTVDPYVKSVEDTTTVGLAVDAAGKLTANAKVSTTANNALTSDANGLFVAEDYIQSIEDTATIDLAVANNQLTGSVKVSATADNVISAEADGLYVSPAKWYAIA